MKNGINLASVIFCFLLTVSTYGIPDFFHSNKNVYISKNLNKTTMSNTYSWDAYPGAQSYIVELKNTATQATHQFETTDTFFSLVGTPAGTYAITVKAKLADGSTTIIVEDIVVL